MMDNKKYIDKVLEHLVRSTKIDYNNNLTSLPFFPFIQHFSSHPFIFPLFSNYSSTTPSSFYKHCKNVFGLTEEEIEYVWKEYKKIIVEKINQ